MPIPSDFLADFLTALLGEGRRAVLFLTVDLAFLEEAFLRTAFFPDTFREALLREAVDFFFAPVFLALGAGFAADLRAGFVTVFLLFFDADFFGAAI